MATGLATAAGAFLTSMIDSRGTVVGAVMVAMTVSALGQAMRAPLGRLEWRLKRLPFADSANQTEPPRAVPVARPAAASRRAGRGGGGVVRSILLIGLLGFVVGMTAISAREIPQAKALIARLVLDPGDVRDTVRTAAKDAAPDDDDATPTREPAGNARPGGPASALTRATTPGGVSQSGGATGQQPATGSRGTDQSAPGSTGNGSPAGTLP